MAVEIKNGLVKRTKRLIQIGGFSVDWFWYDTPSLAESIRPATPEEILENSIPFSWFVQASDAKSPEPCSQRQKDPLTE